MNSTTNLSELEELDDDKELQPAERARLARLMLRITGHDYAEPGSFLRAHLCQLDQEIKAADAATRSQHWQQNADRALAAAKHYIKAQSSGTPVSLTCAAQQFRTSTRSLSRYLEQVKTGSSR
jgi:hypothetical protein